MALRMMVRSLASRENKGDCLTPKQPGREGWGGGGKDVPLYLGA